MQSATISWLVLLVFAAGLPAGCATHPRGYPCGQDRVAAAAYGLGAFGSALGYAATGDARWAAVGGLSGLTAGFILGAMAEAATPVVIEEPPPPPAPRQSRGEPVETPERRRTVTTVVRENGVIVDEYEHEVYSPRTPRAGRY
jgi:hypothetical protein